MAIYRAGQTLHQHASNNRGVEKDPGGGAQVDLLTRKGLPTV